MGTQATSCSFAFGLCVDLRVRLEASISPPASVGYPPNRKAGGEAASGYALVFRVLN